MSVAARTPNPLLQGLARLGSAFLVACARLLTKVDPLHIPGEKNGEADALSRPQHKGSRKIPSLQSVITQWCQLRTCRICLLPSELLHTIARVTSSAKIEEQYDEITTQLLTLKLNFFASWCADMGFQQHRLHVLTDEECITILGTFVFHVSQGINLCNRSNLTAQTLRKYVTAAHKLLILWVGRNIPIYDPNSLGKNRCFVPYIAQQFKDRAAFSIPKPKKLALTKAMYVALAQHLMKQEQTFGNFVDSTFAVYDWLRLGAFTGFRPMEYAQGRVPKGAMFLTVPDSSDVPLAQRNQPLAFVFADWTFYTADLELVPLECLVLKHRAGLVQWVQIRWRFDKSAHNFVYHRFELTGDAIFDPVDAAVSIIHRAQLLGVSTNEPIGVWKLPTGRKKRFLRDSVIKKVMQLSCVLAYPDPDHFYRRNINSFIPHGVRVTAAVLLKLGGAGNDEIAHKLRWHPTSVPTYMRDGFEAVMQLQRRTLRGLDVTDR